MADNFSPVLNSAKDAYKQATSGDNAKRAEEMAGAVTESMAKAMEGVKGLFGKLGAPLAAQEGPQLPLPSAREAADALSKARVDSIAQMTGGAGNGPAAGKEAGYWTSRFGNRGAALASETTASPQGSLPPG